MEFVLLKRLALVTSASYSLPRIF